MGIGGTDFIPNAEFGMGNRGFQRPLAQHEVDCAVYEGTNYEMSLDEISAKMDIPYSHLQYLHERADYREIVENARIEEQKKVAEAEASFIPPVPLPEPRIMTPEQAEALFNSEVERSLLTLVEIRDDREASPTVRLKASTVILEMAPGAPAKKAEQQAPRITIQIPYQQVETIRKAAIEMDQPDLIDLIEGEGYSSSPGAMPTPPQGKGGTNAQQ